MTRDNAHRDARGFTLIEALVAMCTGTALPAAALGAASYAVAARVERLLDPEDRASLARCRATLISALIVLPALTGLVFTIAASA